MPIGVPGEVEHASRGYHTLGLRGMMREEVRPHERFAIIAGLGILGFEIATMVNPLILHPIFPTAALLFLLYPFSRGIFTRRIMQLGVAAFIIWLFVSLSGVLFPFIASFVLAYVFAPLIARLAERGVPRWVSSLVLVLLIIGVYTLIGFMVVPTFIAQFNRLVIYVQSLLSGSGNPLDPEQMALFLQKYGMSPEQSADLVSEYIEPQIHALGEGVIAFLGDFLSNITDVVEGVLNLILIPFITFYLSLDFHRFRRFVREKVLRDDPRFVYYLRNVDLIVNSYIRGIMLTSSMVGAFAVAILSMLGVPFALVLGVLTGVFNLIPTLGIFLNLAVAAVVFMLSPGDFWYNMLVMSATIFGLHAINSYLIEPRIIGDRVGLHPAMVIASLFIFAFFLGFVGLLIAVPLMAVVQMFLREWYAQSIIGSVPLTEREMAERAEGVGSGE